MSSALIEDLPADPLGALRELTRTETELEKMRQSWVAAARASGATWEEIGEALGMTRQSAWEYYASRTRADLVANSAANSELSGDEALNLAVEEVRMVRRSRHAR